MPRFPKQRGRADGSAYGVAQGQLKTGHPSKPGPLEPVPCLPGWAWALHISGGLKAEKVDFPCCRGMPGQMLQVENNLSNDPTTQQRETQPRRGLTFPSALPGPPHLRDAAHLAQRACSLSREQLGSQPGPHDPAALLHGEVRMTKVSDCKSMETPLRCH